MNLRRSSTFLILLLLGVLNMAGMAVSQQSTVPEEARRYYVQANTLFRTAQSKTDFQQAAAMYRQALAVDPQYGNAWYNLSKVQEKLEQYDDAIASLKQFLAVSPNDPEARTAQDHEYELEGMKKAYDAQKERDRIWTDPANELMWTVDTDGQVEVYQTAWNYCSYLSLGGYSNWRLPTILQLRTLYDPNISVSIPNSWVETIHIRGIFQRKYEWSFVGLIWSNSAGTKRETASTFEFGDGQVYDLPTDSGGNTGLMPAHVFCVRITN